MLRRSLALSLLLACSSTPPGGGGTGDDGSTDTGAGSSSGSATDPTTEPTSDVPTGGPPSEDPMLACDPWLQDCPEGEKCTHYNTMGDNTHVDATKCVPVPAMPVPTGSICKATGGLGAGNDDCGPGDFCYFLGEQQTGVCVPLCEGSAAEATCAAGSFCSIGLGSALELCLPACDAFEQNCLEGANCTPQQDGLVCAPDTSGPGGQIYAACGVANGCDPGMMCAPPTAAPDCPGTGEGCCMPLCSVNGGTCPDALECLAVYDPETHPELSAVGVCAAPP